MKPVYLKNDSLFVIAFLSLSCFLLVCNQARAINYKKEGTSILLSFPVPANADKIIFEIHSQRNNSVSKITDVSPANPDGSNPYMQSGKNMWFPVIDLRLVYNMEGVAIFEEFSESDNCWWNSNFWSEPKSVNDTVVFDSHLEHWENHIFVESQTAKLKEFYLREKVSLSRLGHDRKMPFIIETLTPNWLGKIKVYSQSGATVSFVDEVDIEEEEGNLVSLNDGNLIKSGLISSLKSTIRYILACQNTNPLSPTYGGLYLFYDLDAKTYRRSDWIWTYGPAIKLLLEAAKIEEIANEFGYEKLIESAKLIGEASLRFQMLDKDHPAYGITICRYDPKFYYERGFTGYLSPADAHFLAGWGWMPLYEATGDKRYLDATVLQSRQIGKLLEQDSVVEQDFILKADAWKNWTMDESGFGMIGFSEVCKVTKDPNLSKIGKEYINGLIDALERPDGLWYRSWHRNIADRPDDGWPAEGPRGIPVVTNERHTARGNGWAMIGLLASHEMFPENNYYLNKAIVMADRMVELQNEEGAWPFYLFNPQKQYGIGEKGTALWGMLFYQLYEVTKDRKYLRAGEKTLNWCMENQYFGEDPLAAGGIVGQTWASGVVYRNYYPLICTYTMDWFGLTILEALKQEKN